MKSKTKNYYTYGPKRKGNPEIIVLPENLFKCKNCDEYKSVSYADCSFCFECGKNGGKPTCCWKFRSTKLGICI